MKISVLGTGMVGQTIAQKMTELGHKVYMGTRNADETRSRTEPNRMTGSSFSDWHGKNPAVTVLNYGDLPGETDLFINATGGLGSLEALKLTGKDKLKGKTILDIANPLDFSQGFPPSLSVCNTDSLGEQLQREFPESKIVKGLNTMNAYLMVNPAQLKSDHTVFICGNDSEAKAEIVDLLKSMGWKQKNIIDMGDISNARGTEMMLPVWVRLYSALGTPQFNFQIVRE